MEKEIRNDIKGINRFIFEAGADREQLHLHISEVGPGQRAHPPHTHDGQEIFYVFSGEGRSAVWKSDAPCERQRSRPC